MQGTNTASSLTDEQANEWDEWERQVFENTTEAPSARIVSASEMVANMRARVGAHTAPREYRSSTSPARREYREYAVKPIEVLRALGVKKIRQSGGQLHCSSPLRDNDRHPSFSMQADKRGYWTDHGLVEQDGYTKKTGDLVDLLVFKLGISAREAHARLMEGNIFTPVHLGSACERKTDRNGYAKKAIKPQLKRAQHLLQTKMPLPKAVKVLMREFSISESTARRRMEKASSSPTPIPATGKRWGIRSYACLKLLRGEQWVRLQARQIREYYEKRKLTDVGRSKSEVSFLDTEKGRQGARPPTVRYPRASGRGSIITLQHPLFNPGW